MKLKNIVLGIGIIVIFALTLWQGVETFYPTPQYQDYCGIAFEKPTLDLNNQTAQTVYYEQCQKNYEDALKPHSQNVFIISLAVAVIVIILGYFLIKIEPVGSALIGCGIWAIFWGSVINWRNFAGYMRFILLFIALIFVIWLTLRLNKKKK